jgi:hypothetical protein
MDANSRRQIVALVVLLVVLATVVWWNLGPSAEPVEQMTARTVRRTDRRVDNKSGDVVRVRLDALSAAKPEPVGGGRSPFRFTPPPPPPMPTPQRAASAAGGPDSSENGPSQPPPPPPIPLRFIGLVGETAERRMAVLSDGNNVFYGREGDIIEGRYRILRIRLESIELAYADGRGHQVVRRAGS